MSYNNIFDKKSYDEVDKKTKEAVISLFNKLNPGYLIIENKDEYGVDLIVYQDKVPLCYLEVEHVRPWIDKQYPYKEVRLFTRKEHFLHGKDACVHSSCKSSSPFSCKELPHGPLPVLFCLVNYNYTRCLVYSSKDVKSMTRRIVPSRSGPEEMIFLPMDICSFLSMDKS